MQSSYHLFSKFLLFGLVLLSLASCKKEIATPQKTTTPQAPVSSVQAWVVGDTADVQTATTAGILLAGGSTDVDEAMRWFLNKTGGGDIVILRSSGSDGYNRYLHSELGIKVNSVQTFLVDSRDKASDPYMVNKVRNAEGIFIAGGDQATYVNYWKNTPLENAMNYVANTKKAPIGGTSAGCAIQGGVYFAALNNTITSEQALANPFDARITLGKDDFLEHSILKNTITDTHYDNPNRKGRHSVFLAKMVQEGIGEAKGIGVEEKTAVLIEADGTAKVVGTNKAHFLQSQNAKPETFSQNTPLTWDNSGKAIRVCTIQASATASQSVSFELRTWQSPQGIWGFWSIKNGNLVEKM